VTIIPSFIRAILASVENAICIIRQDLNDTDPAVMWQCPHCGCDRGADQDPENYEEMLCGGCLQDRLGITET
jgi:hypothetical protein